MQLLGNKSRNKHMKWRREELVYEQDRIWEFLVILVLLIQKVKACQFFQIPPIFVTLFLQVCIWDNTFIYTQFIISFEVVKHQ